MRLLVLAAMMTATVPSVAATADSRELVPIGSGTGILSLHGVPEREAKFSYGCTLTAIGYDRTGALVGITNAHCFYDNFGDQWLYDGIYLELPGRPAYIDRSVGPIGHVAVIGPGNPVAPGPSGSGLDYAVIVFDQNKVRPAITVEGTTVTAISEPPPPGSPVCKHGHRTGRTCGTVLARNPPYFTTTLMDNPGDSGAPVLFGDAVVGVLWLSAEASSFVGILDELNHDGGPGAGFHIAS